MDPHSMIFANTMWLMALPIVLVLGTVLWAVSRRIARRRIDRFISTKVFDAVPTLDWPRRLVRFALVAAVLMAFAVTLARPLTGPRSDHTERAGVDFVIALDVSKSMWVQDVKPTRLAAVKEALGEWLKKQKGDRIGLIVFAGDAFVQAPMTFDYTALDFVLQDAGPASVSKGGTNIPKAIEVATKMLARNGVDTKALILISDGENLEADAIAAARDAKVNSGITIYTVGVGTPQGGKVPSADPTKPPKPGVSAPSYIRNEYGMEAESRMDRQSLRAIAAAGGGKYYDFHPGEPVFQNLRDQSLMPLAHKSKQLNVQDYNEWFQIPLGAAILLLVLEPLIPAVRRRQTTAVGVAVVQPTTYSRKPRAIATTLVLLLSASAMFATVLQDADKLIAEGKAKEAAELLRQQVEQNENDPYLQYNYALALYRAGDFDQAATIFETLSSATEDSSLKVKALLQTGNSQFQLAEKLKTKGDSAGRVLALERSLSTFDTLLTVSSDRTARNNRELTAANLESLLLEIGAQRIRNGGENALRQAVQVYERAAELNKNNEPLAANARKMLVEELTKQARQMAKDTDEAESAGKPLKDVLAKRSATVAQFQEALNLAPESKDLQDSIKEQQNKMSDLLTKAAKEQADPLLQKAQLSHLENVKLEEVVSKLNEALSLNGDNATAKEVTKSVEDKLVNSYNAAGEENLKGLDIQNRKVESQLFNATKAAEAFNGALKHAPDNEQAKKGLEKANAALPELNSEVGKAIVAKADELTKDGEASKAEAMQAASGLLEKAIQNFGAATAMKPENPEYQKGLAEAQGKLEGLRTQLDKKLAAAGQPANQPGDGEGQSPAAGTMESMNGLRGNKGGGINSEQGRFWENKVRDW
jgi:von Willebrand factor type A domain/Tetratricopeptide repeat